MSILGNCATCGKSRMAEQMGKNGLYCHARPPAIHILPGQQPGTLTIVSLWPEVLGSHWCAEHEMTGDNMRKADARQMVAGGQAKLA